MKKMLAILSLISFSAMAQEFSSETVCRAQTQCFNMYGQPTVVAQCQVFGAAYVTNGASNNSCSWYVVPNVGVKCDGYSQVRNNYGQLVWAWQTFSASCPR